MERRAGGEEGGCQNKGYQGFMYNIVTFNHSHFSCTFIETICSPDYSGNRKVKNPRTMQHLSMILKL